MGESRCFSKRIIDPNDAKKSFTYRRVPYNIEAMQESTKKYVISFILGSVFWFAVLAFSLLNISGYSQESGPFFNGIRYFAGSALISYSFVYGLRVFLSHDDKLILGFDIASVVVALIDGVLLMFFGNIPTAFAVLAIVFYSLLLVRRIPFLIRDHRMAKIVFSIMVTLILGVNIFVTTEPGVGELILPFVTMSLALGHIIAQACSRIRLNLILKIIHRSFVGEILFGLVTLIVVFSFVFYITDSAFDSYGRALWYCFAVFTTIGFGDVVATTILTRILSVVLGLYGIVVTAVITSVIVNFYMETTRKDNAQKKGKDNDESSEEKEDDEETETADELEQIEEKKD